VAKPKLLAGPKKQKNKFHGKFFCPAASENCSAGPVYFPCHNFSKQVMLSSIDLFQKIILVNNLTS
jgi:hypothetical protein